LHTLPLRIKKESINDYLQFLWNRFELEIGTMGCQQSHSNTQDPQIYCYTIRWCSDATNFSATIDIYHHTHKGITSIDLDVVDKVTHLFDEESFNNIKKIIIESSKENFEQLYKKRLFRVPVNCSVELDGDYSFKESEIFIKRNAQNCYVYFYLNYISKHQLRPLIPETAKNIASALTVLTQNLFTFDVQNEVVEYEVGNISDLILTKKGNYSENLSYADFDELIIDNKLVFPKYSDIVFKKIFSGKAHIQSSRRFHEAILMRGGSSYPSTISSLTNGYTTQYELLAYVSSIEALLDSSQTVEKVECPECGHESEVKEYKISKKFRDFVSKYSNQAPTVIKAMKQLYLDRSKFVHTGINLHFHAVRGHGGPFTINGKEEKKEAPYYYYNIHEFTGYLIRSYYYQNLNITSALNGTKIVDA